MQFPCTFGCCLCFARYHQINGWKQGLGKPRTLHDFIALGKERQRRMPLKDPDKKALFACDNDPILLFPLFLLAVSTMHNIEGLASRAIQHLEARLGTQETQKKIEQLKNALEKIQELLAGQEDAVDGIKGMIRQLEVERQWLTGVETEDASTEEVAMNERLETLTEQLAASTVTLGTFMGQLATAKAKLRQEEQKDRTELQVTGIHDVDSLRAGFSHERYIFFTGREHFFLQPPRCNFHLSIRISKFYVHLHHSTPSNSLWWLLEVLAQSSRPVTTDMVKHKDLLFRYQYKALFVLGFQ